MSVHSISNNSLVPFIDYCLCEPIFEKICSFAPLNSIRSLALVKKKWAKNVEKGPIFIIICQKLGLNYSETRLLTNKNLFKDYISAAYKLQKELSFIKKGVSFMASKWVIKPEIDHHITPQSSLHKTLFIVIPLILSSDQKHKKSIEMFQSASCALNSIPSA